MKIERIVLCNLASIEGEQVVDFTKEPLRSAGLFAITGDTGSGKSTLLDAICLALYNRAPRFDDAERLTRFDGRKLNSDTELQAGDTRNILRRGCREGFCEVTFTIPGGTTYRAGWNLKLKRTGTYNKVTRSLERVKPHGERYDEREVDQRIPALIGLDYTQFTRTVILAQNSFANFLRAKQADKSALLEKLTGTAIYGRISRQIYQLNDEANRAYELLATRIEALGTNKMDEADLKQAEESHLLHKSRLNEADQRLKTITEQLQWYAHYDRLAAEHKQHELALQTAHHNYAALYTQQALLERYDQVLCILPLFREIKVMKTNVQTLKTQIETATAETNTCRKQLETAKAQHEAARTVRTEAERTLRERQPQLNAGYALQGEIGASAAELKKKKEAIRQTQVTVAERRTLLASTHNEQNKVQQHITELTQQIQALAVHQRMFEKVDRIREKLARLYEVAEEEKNLRKRYDELQRQQTEQSRTLEQLEAQRTDTESQLETLQAERRIYKQNNYGLDSSELQERYTRNNHILQQLQRAQDLWYRISMGYDTITEKTPDLARRKLLLEQNRTVVAQLAQQVEILSATCERMNTAYTLSQSENIVQLRRRLKEGTACPLCGATHHPYHTETEQELGILISNLEKEYRETADELHLKQEQLQALQREQALEDGLIHAEELHLEQTRKQLKADITGWQAFDTLDTSFTDCSESVNRNARRLLIEQLLEGTGKRVDEARTALDTYNHHQQLINKLSEQIDGLERHLTDTSNRLNEERTAVRVTNSTLEELQKHNQHLDRARRELYEELEEHITLPGWYTEWQQSPENFRNRFERLTNEWNKLKEEAAQTELTAYRVQESVKNIQSVLEEAERHAASVQEETEMLQDAIVHKENELKKLFGNEQPDVVAKRLQLAVQQAAETETSLAQQYNDAHSLWKHRQGQAQSLQEQRFSREGELANRRAELDLWIRRFNADHPAVQFAELERLFGDTRNWNALRNEITQRKEAVTLAQNRLQTTQQQILELKAATGRPSGKDEESREALQANSQELQAHRETIYEELSAVNLRIMAHRHSLEQIGKLADELETLQQQKKRWNSLSALFGSADGKRFREQAQCYTFLFLVEHANRQLEKLSPRYRLRNIPNTLGLEIIDRDMFDETRPVNSLSGGETFIVSLGLALGLSSLSSGNLSIGSLFIDEGFGNLDNDSLELVMDALGNLQTAQGRKVGVISHTEQIRSRITPQIRLIKQPTGGKSTIEIY